MATKGFKIAATVWKGVFSYFLDAPNNYNYEHVCVGRGVQRSLSQVVSLWKTLIFGTWILFLFWNDLQSACFITMASFIKQLTIHFFNWWEFCWVLILHFQMFCVEMSKPRWSSEPIPSVQLFCVHTTLGDKGGFRVWDNVQLFFLHLNNLIDYIYHSSKTKVIKPFHFTTYLWVGHPRSAWILARI